MKPSDFFLIAAHIYVAPHVSAGYGIVIGGLFLLLSIVSRFSEK